MTDLPEQIPDWAEKKADEIALNCGLEFEHLVDDLAADILTALREAQTRPIENVDGNNEPSNGTVVGGVPDRVGMIVKFCREEAAQSQMGPVVRATWAVAADAIERGDYLQGVPVEGEPR